MFVADLLCLLNWLRWPRGIYFPLLKATLGTLSKDVFEPRTSTGSEAFSLFICLDANKLVLLSFFSLLKTIYPRVSTKSFPSDAKSPLPVDVRRSKTLLLKLPINPLSPKKDQHEISNFRKQSGYENWELSTWSGQMSLINILANSPHYFYQKSIGTVNENFNFYIRDYMVKREVRVLENTLTEAVDNKGKSQS